MENLNIGERSGSGRRSSTYPQITQQDLQPESHLACQNVTHRHLLPELTSSASSDPPGIRQALAATLHLLEMYRFKDEKTRHTLQRLDKRFLAVALELDRLGPPGNEEGLAG